MKLINSINSINELMPNRFQIDMDKRRDTPKTKAPNTLQNLDKFDHLQSP